jgi:tRNA(Ile)-lysidine synthase TilS/MesJ
MTIKTCSKCLLTDNIEGVTIGNDNTCNYCTGFSPFKPYGEEGLIKILKKAQRKKRTYDALVPISGGKDSIYVLYLAVKKYGLKVLTYTFDNGFMCELAIKNIENAVKACGVDHIWVKHDTKLLDEFYRTALVNSGEICGICGIGIERSLLKISEAWKTPLILLGHSPVEENSFTSENLYDPTRLKAILAKNPKINKNAVNRFLMFPKLNFINTYLYTKTGRFGKKVNILYYIDMPSDQDIANIIKKEMNWLDSSHSEYSRHFDCLAEPFTNFIREKRFGYSRRLPQLCNMIRKNEITREEAIEINNNDNKGPLPINYDIVTSRLDLKEKDIDEIGKIPVHVFDDQTSSANKIFAKARRILKKNKH